MKNEKELTQQQINEKEQNALKEIILALVIIIYSLFMIIVSILLYLLMLVCFM